MKTEQLSPDWFGVFEVDPRPGGPYHVDFKVYHTYLQPTGGIVFDNEDDEEYSNPVDTYQEASVYVHGHVKWDGCSNWHFDEQDRAMLHFCDLPDLAEMMDLVYRFCASQMPNQDVSKYLKEQT